MPFGMCCIMSLDNVQSKYFLKNNDCLIVPRKQFCNNFKCVSSMTWAFLNHCLRFLHCRELMTRKAIYQVEWPLLNKIICDILTADVEIQITDINDNAPSISPVNILEITESATLTQPLLLTTLTVTDADLTAQLEFSISNNPDGVYSINNRGKLSYCPAVFYPICYLHVYQISSDYPQ